MITVDRIQAVEDFIFRRLEDDLAEVSSHDYYLSGKDIYQYTQSLRNLEELKKTAEAE